MSVLQANLPDHACYGVNSQGVEYLEFSCVYNIEAYYARYDTVCLLVRVCVRTNDVVCARSREIRGFLFCVSPFSLVCLLWCAYTTYCIYMYTYKHLYSVSKSTTTPCPSCNGCNAIPPCRLPPSPCTYCWSLEARLGCATENRGSTFARHWPFGILRWPPFRWSVSCAPPRNSPTIYYITRCATRSASIRARPLAAAAPASGSNCSFCPNSPNCSIPSLLSFTRNRSSFCTGTIT